MIRIVFLVRSLNRGGTERQLATLVRAMDGNRFDLTVLTFYPDAYFAKEISEHHIRVISLRKRGRWDVIRFCWRLITQLRRIRPQVIYSFLVEPNLLTVFLKPFLRTTKIVWGVRASNMELQLYDWFTRLNFSLQVFASRFADLIIFNSKAGRDYHLAHGFPPRTAEVIHGGVDTESFKPDRAAGKSVRAAWGIKENYILIGLVARLDPMKDHLTFIKAAAQIAREDSNLRWVCVGGGPAEYNAQLRLLAEENQISDRLIWAGEHDDMSAVYNALDVACCSSAFGEGLSNTIAEAMACDVACVVTDVGDSALLVGETGIVVPPHNPEALAAGLKQCIENLRAGSAPDPRQRILNEFDLRRLVERTEAALGSLMQS